MIEFQGVSKVFAGHPAVKDLTLELREGAFSVLVGTSGSGKSTTLKMINRLLEPDRGTIRFAGEDIRLQPVLTLRRRMGYAIQSIGLFPHWTVAQNIATVPQLQKWPRARIADRVDELMALLGLEATLRDRYPHQLSGGQQQRVGVARALAADPEVLLMDEPFGALDPVTREALQQEMLRIHRLLGRTIVLVTHDIDEALRLADHLVLMDGGEVVQQGAPLAIYDQPCNTFVARFIGSPPMNLLPGQRDVRNGQPGVACGALWFPLAERWHQAVANQGDAPLIVGLRPQDILPDAHGALATVNIMEVTGESTLLHLDWQGFPVHVQVAGRVAVAAQQTLGLTLRCESLHLFDAASGERLAETR